MQTQQSDLTFWAVVALVTCGVAVLSTLSGAFIPVSVFGSLHTSRLEGGTLNQLRAQVEQLRGEQAEILNVTSQLRSQFSLSERNRNEVSQRVGALETSIPLLLEVVPPGAEIDPLSITASVNEDNGTSYDVEGGSVSISQSPLFDSANGAGPDGGLLSQQPVPDVLDNLLATTTQPDVAPEAMMENQDMETATGPMDTPLTDMIDAAAQDTSQMSASGLGEVEISLSSRTNTPQGSATLSQTQFGIAVGAGVAQADADAQWQDISNKIGTLLIGLEPAISDPLQNGSYRIVLGPITNYSEAEMLCTRITQVGIECLPIQYEPS